MAPDSSASSASEGEETPGDASAEEFDEFGFAMPGDDLGESTRAYAARFQPKAARRLGRLEARRRKLKKPGEWSTVPKKTMKALLRKGVPAQHRAEVWWSVLECEERRQQSASGYADHAAGNVGAKTLEDIDRDLHRTFPGHKRYRTVEGRQELGNVLRAFAHYAPRVQYCQGLNFIAALLLVVLGDEERAFWCLACAFDRIDVEGYYTEGMTLLRSDMLVLSHVLSRWSPKVSKAFKESGVDLISICSEWHITWFAKCLPTSTVLRVWDTLFFEGFKVLFRVSYGILKKAEADILADVTFEGIMQRSRDWPRNMVDHNELLKSSFGMSRLRRRDLLQVREAAICEVDREDDERRRRVENRENAAA